MKNALLIVLAFLLGLFLNGIIVLCGCQIVEGLKPSCNIINNVIRKHL